MSSLASQVPDMEGLAPAPSLPLLRVGLKAVGGGVGSVRKGGGPDLHDWTVALMHLQLRLVTVSCHGEVIPQECIETTDITTDTEIIQVL